MTAAVGAIGILRLLIRLSATVLPHARIRVRLDGGFADPEVLDFLDAESGVEYVVAMAKNAVLNRLAEPAMRQARKLSQQSGETEHLYGEARYAAGTWSHERRVIFKAEVVRAAAKDAQGQSALSSSPTCKQSPQWIYEQVYCQRGEIENRIKELHDLEIDRTSCSQFWANQFRVLLTAAAYVLMQELRLRAAAHHCARAQVWTLRERLLKLGAHVVVGAPRGGSSAGLVPISSEPSAKWRWRSGPCPANRCSGQLQNMFPRNRAA